MGGFRDHVAVFNVVSFSVGLWQLSAVPGDIWFGFSCPPLIESAHWCGRLPVRQSWSPTVLFSRGRKSYLLSEQQNRTRKSPPLDVHQCGAYVSQWGLDDHFVNCLVVITFQLFYVVDDGVAGVEFEGDHGGTHCEVWIGSPPFWVVQAWLLVQYCCWGKAVQTLMRSSMWNPLLLATTSLLAPLRPNMRLTPFAANDGRSSLSLLSFSAVCNSWQDLAF